MTEGCNIPDLDFYIHDKVLSPYNGKNMQATKVIGRSNDRD